MRNFWHSKGMSRRGVLAVCLAFVLTLSLLPQVFGITEGATATNPNLTITAVGVENTYVELGLNIQAQENGFRSVGAVVTYDPALLIPVDWAQEPTAVTLTEQPADADTYNEEEARTDWNTAAAALETKGPDELSGKTALAYVKGGVEPAGYLYLAAEAPRLIEGGTEENGTYTGGWNQTLPEVAELMQDDGATPVTTANGVPVVVPSASPLESPVEQSVVVRFKLKGDMATALASIDLATGSVATGSPAYDDSGVAYFHNDKGESIAVNAKILRAEVGTTYFTGGEGGGTVNMDGVLSVTFYDWDETLLGTLAVPAGVDISERVNDYVRRFIHPDLNDVVEDGESLGDSQIKAIMASNARTDTYRGKFPSTYGDDNTIDLGGSDYPLTNKLDYVFYKGDTTGDDYDGYYFAHGWIPVTAQTLDGRADNGVFTAYASAEEAAAANPVDFSLGLTDSIMVKAAYVAGELLKTGAAEGLYTITNIAYNRYGVTTQTAGSYSLVSTIERVNADGYGVTRLRWPAFYITVKPDVADAQDIALRIDVDSKDMTTGEVVAPRGSSNTILRFIDVVSENWLNVAQKALLIEVPRDGDQGYLVLGTVKAINSAVKDLYEGDMTTAEFGNIVNAITYEDLGITISANTVGGANAQRFNIARNKLQLGYVASCGQEMDLEYIEGVLYMKLSTPAINNTSNYNNALANVQTAVAANGNQPLTVEQVEYAINNSGALLQ